MRQKIWPILFITFLSNNCAHLSVNKVAPQITVYVSTPISKGLVGYSQVSKKTNFLQYDQTDKFVCFNPDDLQILLRQCAQPGGL